VEAVTAGVFLTARWSHLAMLNREVDRALLMPLLPAGVELDDWNGAHHVSAVGFLFLGTRVLGVPVPFHADFEEVNLRFYVRRESGGSLRRGVVFVRELVPRRLIALIGRHPGVHRRASSLARPARRKRGPRGRRAPPLRRELCGGGSTGTRLRLPRGGFGCLREAWS
jgi:hypothetical protein